MTHAGMVAGAAFLMVAVMATAAVVGRFSPFYRRELARAQNRELPLDGLRGMAALMVVAHHAGLYYNWLVTDKWTCDSAFLLLLGPAGVTIFFMLTGYLFWKKARAAKGKIKALKLWRGRLFRIGPLYWFSVCLVLIIAIVKTHARVLALTNWEEWLRLLLMGGISWKSAGDANFASYNAYVTWTLTYEWRFYAFLPLLAWLSLGRRTYGLALLAYLGTVAALWRHMNVSPWLSVSLAFIPGMMCAIVLDDDSLRLRLRQPMAAIFALCAMALLLAINPGPWRTLALPGALLPLFLVSAAGNSLFGFLTQPAIRCLGAISYSLYLLHGIIFYGTMNALKKMGLSSLSGLSYWLIVTAAAAATALLCAATYRWIEFPFISRGHTASSPKAPVPIKLA